MKYKKTVLYKLIDQNGRALNNEYLLTLNVIENSGNYLMHKLLLTYKNNLRQNTVLTKTRAEVQGGGRKPWRQKGTGKARAGSTRSPLWRGGGVIFGPEREVKNIKCNKKEKNLALNTLLYNRRNSTFLIEGLEDNVNLYKTKNFISICEKCNIDISNRLLIIVSNKILPLKLSIRNLKAVELISANNLNIISILKSKNILLTKLSLNIIKELYCA